MWQEEQGPGNLAVFQALENIEDKFQRSFTSLLSLKRPVFKETSTLSRHSHWAAKDRPFWGIIFPCTLLSGWRVFASQNWLPEASLQDLVSSRGLA